jgi:hypothetical protein
MIRSNSGGKNPFPLAPPGHIPEHVIAYKGIRKQPMKLQ